MRYIRRDIEDELQAASRLFAALIITGPRRAGKTTLLRRLFSKASYVLLEDPDVVARVRSDPRGFLHDLKLPVILDEIQNTPELLSYIRTHIDLHPRLKGQWFITGSQEAPLMKGVTESMAGRAALFTLLPLSCVESPKVSMFYGGFPEVLAKPRVANIWYRSYVQTYLERDVRQIGAIRDLATFRRFIALVASRNGQVLNRTDFATALGMSVPTISQWLGILEMTAQIHLVPPFYEDLGKRLIKSPKLYFVDSGLLCYLLGIDSAKALERSPFLGSIFEGFVASEFVKQQINGGRQRAIYFFRDQQGLEVDFLVPGGDKKLMLVEAKVSRTATPHMATSLERLGKTLAGYEVKKVLVYRPIGERTQHGTLRPGIKAMALHDALRMIPGHHGLET
ncbi:MAG: ATP-binding protein [Ignavibacteriae bacterium]|nr:ATP-binding protein [Ignavibacteriota bacterium]